jgi:hypothetical protein
MENPLSTLGMGIRLTSFCRETNISPQPLLLFNWQSAISDQE